MPFFFIVPIWLLCVVMGLLTLVVRRFRFLASYLILGSTLGLIVSAVLSIVLALLLGKVMVMVEYQGSLGGIVILLGYLAGLVAGGLAGMMAGGLLAYRVNLWAGLRATRMQRTS